MRKVYVVTGFDLGWDNVVATFDPNKVTQEQIEKRFPEDNYYIQLKDIETDLSMWDA